MSRTRVFALLATLLAMTGVDPAHAQSVDVRGLAAKLAPVIACINRVDMKMTANARVYRETVARLSADPMAQALPYLSFKIEPYEANNAFSTECAAGLDKTVSMPPKVADLDQTARAYAATLRALIPLMNEAEPYYAEHDYREDKFERGRQMDATLSPLLERIVMLSRDLRAEADREEVQVRRAELDAMATREGKSLHYWTVDLMLEARFAIERINTSLREQKLTAEAVDNAIGPLQATFDSATRQAAAHPDDAARYTIWSKLQPAVTTYLGAVKTLRRDLADKATGAKVGTDLRSTVQAFNDLVTSYNAVSQAR